MQNFGQELLLEATALVLLNCISVLKNPGASITAYQHSKIHLDKTRTMYYNSKNTGNHRETTNFGGSIMNKAELIEAIATETGVTKKDVDAVLKSFVTVVSDTLQKKDKVQLIGFGTFETAERAARTGRNPANGEAIKIAASTLVKFKAGAALKEKVNTKPAKKSKKK